MAKVGSIVKYLHIMLAVYLCCKPLLLRTHVKKTHIAAALQCSLLDEKMYPICQPFQGRYSSSFRS